MDFDRLLKSKVPETETEICMESKWNENRLKNWKTIIGFIIREALTKKTGKSKYKPILLQDPFILFPQCWFDKNG